MVKTRFTSPRRQGVDKRTCMISTAEAFRKGSFFFSRFAFFVLQGRIGIALAMMMNMAGEALELLASMYCV